MYKFNKRVGFGEVDAAGVMFFARAFEYFHIAYESFMAEIGCDLHQMFIQKGTALPIVHSEADYKKPIQLGEQISIICKITNVGTRSYSIAYQILGEDKTLRVKGLTKHVFVGKDFKSTAMPEDMRKILLNKTGEK